MLVKLVDPKGDVFEHRLYQNACYVFEKRDEDIFHMLKDVTRFKSSRDMSRTLLLDPNPLNFMLSPENGLPFVGYNAEHNERDEYLKGVAQQLTELLLEKDVRGFLKEHYHVRQILKNAKLMWL